MNKAANGLAALEKRLGYRFRERALLEEALTHVSHAGAGGPSYQRLEFLGDRVLGIVVATMLFEAFPDAPEGDLSKRLAELVRKETCADVARSWQLGELIRLGEGERRNGAQKRDAILGDVCEAVIGAIYLDAGLAEVDRCIRAAWISRMHAPIEVPRDPKTTLQEAVQARGLPVPRYRDAGRRGPDHAPEFEIAVEVEGFAPIIGKGASKRHAERAAAENFLATARFPETVKGSP
jgi:ribonuclease-3